MSDKETMMIVDAEHYHLLLEAVARKEEKTLRDEIAIAAMQGMLVSDITAKEYAIEVFSYELADRMLKERSKINDR